MVKILSSKTAEINKLQVYKGNATHFFSTDLPILNPINIELHANLYIRLLKFCKMIRSFKIFLISPGTRNLELYNTIQHDVGHPV